ncbi:NAD(P)/FAD-dependent oxidoreductase [Salegentibacter chungangensis]|uniref:NAD(P)/FAD-dependent oxidoreductase n=1 Tax=Salegentibacter chungangensis TaxID=1335724 RepID=A0ABW3NQR0_9FLAO
MKKRSVDILIIGAGPSGMVSAGYLNKQGISILVVEKSSFPRFSIGESLIPRCMDNFEEAGLLNPLKNAGFQKKYGARFIKNGRVREFDFSNKYGNGWDWTWQVPRAEFDNILAKENQRKGVEILFETEVTSVEFQGNKSVSRIKDKKGKIQEIQAGFIIDSSGNGRVLAKQLGLEAKPGISAHSSIFTHISETMRPEGKEGELISFEVLDTRTWFWYIPFSNGNSSLGFVGPNEWFDKYGTNTTETFYQMLGQTRYYEKRFNDYDFLFQPVRLKNIAKAVTRLYGNGYAITGNSAEFLDPIFSSGVAFATESGLLAAKLALRELNEETVNWETEYTDYLKRGIAVFSSYVREWYNGNLQRIFFYSDPNPEIERQICSVLAGYVWNETNPFVKKHQRIIGNVANLIK